MPESALLSRIRCVLLHDSSQDHWYPRHLPTSGLIRPLSSSSTTAPRTIGILVIFPDSITLVGQRWANGTCTDGPTVAATGGPLWVCPTSLCWPTGGYSHRWASVGPPLGQRWLATGGPLLAHRWLATVGPTVGQRYTNDKCAVGPTMASHR